MPIACSAPATGAFFFAIGGFFALAATDPNINSSSAIRNDGPALCFLRGKPHIAPRYGRLVRRWLLYPGCVCTSSFDNAWLGVSNTTANEGCRPVLQQVAYRLISRWLNALPPAAFSTEEIKSCSRENLVRLRGPFLGPRDRATCVQSQRLRP